jgi:hypothetical protein
MFPRRVPSNLAPSYAMYLPSDRTYARLSLVAPMFQIVTGLEITVSLLPCHVYLGL